MKILVMEIKIRISWVTSLKEKRMILRSIRDRLKNKFNISISETGSNDEHKLITLGIVAVGTDKNILWAMEEKIISFIEENCEGEIINIYKDIEIY